MIPLWIKTSHISCHTVFFFKFKTKTSETPCWGLGGEALNYVKGTLDYHESCAKALSNLSLSRLIVGERGPKLFCDGRGSKNAEALETK